MSKPYPIMNGRVSPEPEPQPQLGLTKEQAAFWGVPQNTEDWRFEVYLAATKPAFFIRLLSEATPVQLSNSYHQLGHLLLCASYDVTRYVPADRADEFLDLITKVRELILMGAARRALNLQSGDTGTPEWVLN